MLLNLGWQRHVKEDSGRVMRESLRYDHFDGERQALAVDSGLNLAFHRHIVLLEVGGEIYEIESKSNDLRSCSTWGLKFWNCLSKPMT